MRRADDLLRHVDGWVFGPEDARRLAAVRIGVCALVALRLAVTDYGVVAGQPAVLYRPLGYMNLIRRMPSPGVTTALQICGVVAALLAAAGLAIRASLPLAFVCSLVLNGMLNSAGRIIVGDAVLTLCLLVLLACGGAAGEAWTLRAPVRRALGGPVPPPGPDPDAGHDPTPCGPRYGWPVRTAMIAIAIAYFFSGFQKWRHSGIPWVTSDNLRWALYASSDSQAQPNGFALFIADRPVLAHLFAMGSLLLETGFPLMLLFPRLRWIFIPGVVAMHIAIRLTMDLDYSAQWLTAVIVFVNWPVVVARFGHPAAPIPVPHQAPG